MNHLEAVCHLIIFWTILLEKVFFNFSFKIYNYDFKNSEDSGTVVVNVSAKLEFLTECYNYEQVVFSWESSLKKFEITIVEYIKCFNFQHRNYIC